MGTSASCGKDLGFTQASTSRRSSASDTVSSPRFTPGWAEKLRARSYYKPPVSMDCKTCDALLADYERSVHVFMNAVLTFREAEGDDSTMSVEEMNRLSQNCKDT